MLNQKTKPRQEAVAHHRIGHQGRTSLIWTLGGVVAAVVTFLMAGAAAASILPTSEDRFVRRIVYLGNPPSTTTYRFPPAPFADFDENLSGAAQVSSIALNSIIGTGVGGGSGPFAGNGTSNLSNFDLTFEVDVAQDYELSLTGGTWGEGNGSVATWRVDGVQQFQQYGPSCPFFCNSEIFESYAWTLSLTPGVVYRLHVRAVQGGLDGGGSFDFSLLPVPEPSMTLMLMLGGGGIAVAGRKRRSSD